MQVKTTALGTLAAYVGGQWHHGISVEAVASRDGEIARQVAEWLDSGGAITEYEAPTPTEADYAEAIQAHVDNTARGRGYADGVALSSYVTSKVEAWAAEAKAFVAWRDAVWLAAYQALSDVQAGKLPQPSVSEFIAKLPAISWP